jgi:pyruvate kinase
MDPPGSEGSRFEYGVSVEAGQGDDGRGPMRRAKIVCTLGPATGGPQQVRALIDAGMDVARINFSHGSDEEHRAALQMVRDAAEASGRTVAALADLSGPKVRIGELEAGEVHLHPGMRFELRPGGPPGDETGVPTSHAGLGHDVETGDRILLADGAVELMVLSGGDVVVTEVVKAARDGTIRTHAGLNAPAERLSIPSITDKDRADLDHALALGFDLVAQSFVRSARDVEDLRALMAGRAIPIVAKVETRPAVNDAPAIATAADVVMIARGDLGVEIALEEVPVVQKELIRACRGAGTPTIVATQMLESMVASPRPTRAEASDAANAILDGADAVMLSAETAIGQYPIEAAQTAERIATLAEDRGAAFELPPPPPSGDDEGRAIARAACDVFRSGLPVAAVACFTRTGRTAKLLAAERPEVPIFAFSSDQARVRALSVVWGVTPFLCDLPGDIDELIELMDHMLVRDGLVGLGEAVVMVAAAPLGKAHTNLLKVHRLGSPGVRSDGG